MRIGEENVRILTMGYSMDSSNSMASDGASLVAALTPTPVDDGWVKKIYTVMDWVALNVGKAKDK